MGSVKEVGAVAVGFAPRVAVASGAAVPVGFFPEAPAPTADVAVGAIDAWELVPRTSW